RGTLIHAFLARLDLTATLDEPGLHARLRALLASGFAGLNPADEAWIAGMLDPAAIAWFFTTELGRKMQAEPGRVRRELPFTTARPLALVDPAAAAAFPHERIVVQGVIDAAIDEGDSVFLIDYKTDRPRGDQALRARVDHYRPQLMAYARALT